jgi:prepilin-type N-terminal cleavage/methylation domain-containing protein
MEQQKHTNWRRRQRRGFTIIELLVTIGVIALLAGLLLPMVLRSYRQSGRMRVQGDLQVISTALAAYHQDFGDYPRYEGPNTGAAVLGKALVGPYGNGVTPSPPDPPGTTDRSDPPYYDSTKPYKPGECVTNGTERYVTLVENTGGSLTDTSKYAVFDPRDSADGPGFRSRPGAGKVWGPYLAAGKLKTSGVYLLDHHGGPIL